MSEAKLNDSELIFCSNCDYAISKLTHDEIQCRPDSILCPRCKQKTFDCFYSIGSQTHKNRRESWERGEISGSPLPFHNPATGKEA